MLVYTCIFVETFVGTCLVEATSRATLHRDLCRVL